MSYPISQYTNHSSEGVSGRPDTNTYRYQSSNEHESVLSARRLQSYFSCYGLFMVIRTFGRGWLSLTPVMWCRCESWFYSDVIIVPHVYESLYGVEANCGFTRRKFEIIGLNHCRVDRECEYETFVQNLDFPKMQEHR